MLMLLRAAWDKITVWLHMGQYLDASEYQGEAVFWEMTISPALAILLLVCLHMGQGPVPRRSAKHRHVARKATSTEAARDHPEVRTQTILENPSLPPPSMTQRRAVTTHSWHESTVFPCFFTGCQGNVICRNHFINLFTFRPMPGSSGMQSQTIMQGHSPA